MSDDVTNNGSNDDGSRLPLKPAAAKEALNPHTNVAANNGVNPHTNGAANNGSNKDRHQFPSKPILKNSNQHLPQHSKQQQLRARKQQEEMLAKHSQFQPHPNNQSQQPNQMQSKGHSTTGSQPKNASDILKLQERERDNLLSEVRRKRAVGEMDSNLKNISKPESPPFHGGPQPLASSLPPSHPPRFSSSPLPPSSQNFSCPHDVNKAGSPHSVQCIEEKDLKRMCFQEFFKPGSCPRDPCPFTHDIPIELRNCEAVINKVKGIQAAIKRHKRQGNRF